MSKRRHEADFPPAKAAKGFSGSDSSGRLATLKAYITALNKQFVSWVYEQKGESISQLWTDGLKDYLEHAETLLQDFKDVIDSSNGASPGSAAAKPAASSLFGAPAETAAAPAFGSGFGAPAASTGGLFTFGGGAASSAAPPSSPAPFKLGGAEKATGPLHFGASSSQQPDNNGTPPAPSTSFNFGSKPSEPAAPPATSQPASLFTFGGGSAASSAPASTTTTTTTTSGLFNFGSGSGAAVTTGTTGSLFNFGNSSKSAANPFTFGSAAAPAPGGAGGAQGDEGEDAAEEEAPAKFESEVGVSEEAGTVLFKTKAKFMHLVKDADGKASWEGKGVGTMMVRQRPDALKFFLTFTTEAGRVLYIANMHKDMKVILNDSVNSAAFALPWSVDGSSPPTLQQVMFKMGKDKHKEFKKEVDNAVAKLA
mmetsp:Transcript_16294/g.35220  ORF Transcript_16294/g.35220 Transcript_16294/m.35220 type:complete len:424 (+) Transcript_16294:29-1300(+)|eukprot:CAMPEP_0202891760 /NCGR_PEP_ID=MMETSP1392-20130828/1745_1 /ASSEMBLY_ACC=CAM_ASM_000868 /TAXON_ID=225041 /ORGANISM="Chlamydomonas chlamydogama, Strain SAG 11-48b" /LENGTH=423 /DNA_ID=CAMNT_0049575613 /DNA_START=18 /DNA_END=1289 /DNA_ORIENTATION=-